MLGLGALFLLVPIGYLGTRPLPASALALIIAVLVALWWAVARWRSWRAARTL